MKLRRRKNKKNQKKNRFSRFKPLVVGVLSTISLAISGCFFNPEGIEATGNDGGRKDATVDVLEIDASKKDAVVDAHKDVETVDAAKDSMVVDAGQDAEIDASQEDSSVVDAAEPDASYEDAEVPDSAVDSGIVCSNLYEETANKSIWTTTPVTVGGFELVYKGLDGNGNGLVDIKCDGEVLRSDVALQNGILHVEQDVSGYDMELTPSAINSDLLVAEISTIQL